MERSPYMKISIDQHVLLKPLEQADKFVSTKTTIPILSEVLLEANEDGLTITGGDGFQYLRTKVGIDDLQVIEPGTITLQSKKIVEIAKKIKGVIDIKSNGTEVLVSGNRKNYEMESLDPEEYPQFKNVSGSSVTKIDGRTFISLIKETSYAAHDKEDNPILTGLRLRVESNLLSFTATNRHRLAYSVKQLEDADEFTTVIGARALSELSKLIAGSEEIEIYLNGSEFHAKTKEFTFFSRVLEGAYPAVDRIYPQHFATTMTVHKDNFLDALEGAFIIVKDEKQKLVRMIVDEDRIELRSKASGVGKASEVIETEHIHGDKFQVSFNGQYALDAIKSINSEEIWIGCTGLTSPIVFKGTPDDQNQSYRVILPYRVTEDAL